jgi:hypothetical protein
VNQYRHNTARTSFYSILGTFGICFATENRLLPAGALRSRQSSNRRIRRLLEHGLVLQLAVLGGGESIKLRQK